MKKVEKIILKKAVKDKRGLFSPADMINGIAERDKKALHRLITRGFIEEVPTEINQIMYTFYRVTEKGVSRANFIKWIWFNCKTYIYIYLHKCIIRCAFSFFR